MPEWRWQQKVLALYYWQPIVPLAWFVASLFFSLKKNYEKIKVGLCFCALCPITAKGSQASRKLILTLISALALTLTLASYQQYFGACRWIDYCHWYLQICSIT
jgi:hypothetical protein